MIIPRRDSGTVIDTTRDQSHLSHLRANNPPATIFDETRFLDRNVQDESASRRVLLITLRRNGKSEIYSYT